MKARLYLIIPVLFLWTNIGFSQGLVAFYSFDDCTASDNSGNASDGVITGEPECVCGVSMNALHLDGNDDFVQFLGDFDILFSNNFTISFYLNPEQTTGTADIMSKREICSSDQSVAIKYQADTRTLTAEISEDVTNIIRNSVILPTGHCWHHITWVRNGNIHRLYLDGEQVDEAYSQALIPVASNGVFSIANGPCLMNGELRFRGALDELRFYNRALTPAEIMDLYVPIDQILNQDTIIFMGNSIQVKLPLSCADQVQWTPTTGVSMPGTFEPVIQPFASTTYQVSLDYGHCIATDTLSLIVVDSTELSCEEIYFPRAFTPNGDGLNDVFRISNAAFLGEFESFKIYDRWGGEVFVAQRYNDGWDGEYKGEAVQPGMYVYKFRFFCEGEEKLKVGSLTLIR